MTIKLRLITPINQLFRFIYILITIVDIQCSANRDKNLILTIDFSRAPV